MKLLSFGSETGVRIGVAEPEGIIDLTAALGSTHPQLSHMDSMLNLIESGIDIDTIGAESLRELRQSGSFTNYLVADPVWLPPIPRPPKILALALNYQEHIDETKLTFLDEPIIFTKYSSNLIGHEADIELPPFPQKVDEEHELALVVGRNCRHIRPGEAPAYVFGYTLCNDVSARDRQRERMKMGQPYAYAKNFATFCPLGPWIVTAKEVGDPRNLACEVRINGKVTRRGNTRDMIFDPFEVLAYCSDYTPMEAGDVIALGTFAGEKQIRSGDMVELDCERIGVLRNRVVPAKTSWPNFTANLPTGPLVKAEDE